MPTIDTLRLILIAVLAAIFSSCGSHTTKNTYSDKTVREMQHWQAKGKLSVIYQNKSNSAYFDWDNRGEEFTIHLHGPLGQGSVYLKKEDGLYTLQDGTQKYSEESAEDLLYSQLGMQFPVSDLIYWIRGIRAPGGRKRISFLPSSNTLHQKGWTINYPRQKMHQGYLLPEKLVATREELKLTMIIKRWDIE